MIRFEKATKVYPDGTKAVHTMDLEIKKGEFFVFIGPSGCGKTTTMKMINRLIDASDGTVLIQDKNVREYEIHELRWNIGYVLQQIALFPHMTIEENIAIVPELKKWKPEQIKKRVDELLEMVGLDPATYRSRKPSELSGGQQQRIGVVRALAADPDIILMDEPFSALDPISREKLQNDIADLQKRIKKTIVFVTHDMQEALALGDRIAIMKEGRIVQVDTPEGLVNHPADDFVKEFIGSRSIPDKKFRDGKIGDLSTAFQPAPEGFPEAPVSYELPISEAIVRLKGKQAISVQKDGVVIGIVTAEMMMEYLAGELGMEGVR
ncbi:betaine/proline/choline family ABC transporter ATP-binding protein [Bacillus mangrovi]|uniref:Quaternary amine transport ATP-binding protein n=1 Tax=Metabacillus mangrovi TaxID=1491830 RepID=A0A7X2S785_9BACI|nr:ABC transporter ATP-binding protein [Metabacillus mangrovi]MTH54755.1 betaine/proline/choline family ABC transporter ATP-binding protein [Metabacillus mangrovi]